MADPGSSARAAAATGPHVVVVMSVYNAASTLVDTFRAIPPGAADETILVDDGSSDETVRVDTNLGIDVIVHRHNLGYGGNQKTCYLEALKRGADIVVMLHPDGQYDPTLVPDIIEPIKRGEADLVLRSRFLRPGGPAADNMPRYKIFANRFLTTCENWILGTHFSELHTGYRAYSRHFLETIPFLRNVNPQEVVREATRWHAVGLGEPLAGEILPHEECVQTGQLSMHQSVALRLAERSQCRQRGAEEVGPIPAGSLARLNETAAGVDRGVVLDDDDPRTVIRDCLPNPVITAVDVDGQYVGLGRDAGAAENLLDVGRGHHRFTREHPWGRGVFTVELPIEGGASMKSPVHSARSARYTQFPWRPDSIPNSTK